MPSHWFFFKVSQFLRVTKLIKNPEWFWLLAHHWSIRAPTTEVKFDKHIYLLFLLFSMIGGWHMLDIKHCYRTSAYLIFLFIVSRHCSTQLRTGWKNSKKWTKRVCTRWMRLNICPNLVHQWKRRFSHVGTTMKSSSSEKILIFSFFCL